MLNFEIDLDFSSSPLKEYLADLNVRDLILEPSAPQDFVHDENDRRSVEDQNGDPIGSNEQFSFLVEERFDVLENGKKITAQKALVTFDAYMDIQPSIWLYFHEDVEEDRKNVARGVFNSYDSKTHGPDIEKYARDNLNGVLTEDDYSLLVGTKIECYRSEYETSQRDALFAQFGLSRQGEHGPGQIDVIDGGEYGTDAWARYRNITLKLTGTHPTSEDQPTSDPTNTREVPDVNDSNATDTIIDDILRTVISPDCGTMAKKKIRLLTLFSWPEFRVVWKSKSIKVGCARITISYPQIQIRISRMVFFVYYKLPRNIDRTVFKIAETCAVRSALTSAIIGALTTNLPVAIASFKKLFIKCMEKEMKKCLYPGLLLLKEVERDWRPL